MTSIDGIKQYFWKCRAKFRIVQKNLFGLAVVQNVALDLRYGKLLGNIVPSRFSDTGAYRTQSTNYAKLTTIFKRVRISPDDVLVDVGCGEGRVINFWLHKGHKNKIVGVELDDQIAADTRNRLLSYDNVTILNGDICELFPSDGTLFYLYNPFNEAILLEFLDLILRRSANVDKVRIIYNVPRHIEAVRSDGRWKVIDLYSGIQEGACLVLPALGMGGR